MSRPQAFVTFMCKNMHMTEVEILNPIAVTDAEGNVTIEGVTGSSADFCDVCGSDEMTAMSMTDNFPDNGVQDDPGTVQ